MRKGRDISPYFLLIWKFETKNPFVIIVASVIIAFRNKCLSILKTKLTQSRELKIERNINRINDRWLVILFEKKKKRKENNRDVILVNPISYEIKDNAIKVEGETVETDRDKYKVQVSACRGADRESRREPCLPLVANNNRPFTRGIRSSTKAVHLFSSSFLSFSRRESWYWPTEK